MANEVLCEKDFLGICSALNERKGIKGERLFSKKGKAKEEENFSFSGNLFIIDKSEIRRHLARN